MAERISISLPVYLAEEIDSRKPKNLNKSEYIASLITKGMRVNQAGQDLQAKKVMESLNEKTIEFGNQMAEMGKVFAWIQSSPTIMKAIEKVKNGATRI